MAESRPEPAKAPNRENHGDFVYAGFGSMKSGDAVKRGGMVVAAARRNGLKTLVAEGWGGIEIPAAARGGDVLVRKSVPHDLVLPRAAAAIHHGGAGTVPAVARAGIPSVMVPFIADQPFWGRVLQRGPLCRTGNAGGAAGMSGG